MAFRKINLHQMTDSTVTDFTDSVLVLGKDNTSETDVGFLGKIGTDKYAGLVYDSATQEFLLIDDVTVTNTTNDVSSDPATFGDLNLSGITVNTKIVLPKGTASQRPSNPEEGQMWFNTETKMFEGYDGTQWQVFVPAQLQIN